MSMDIAVDCFELTKGFPRSELFGMTSQIRRASASIPANIAEGHGVNRRVELETHLLLSGRLGIGSSEKREAALARCDEVGRMLRSLIRSLQDRN